MDFEIVVVEDGGAEIVVVEDKAADIIVEAVQGPPGPPGINYVGGFPVTVANPRPGDLISFANGQFINQPAASLTDGGNF
jgi:hypothetical protein